MGPNVNQYEFAILTIYKNVVKNFVTITILLKELMMLLKGQECNFIKQIAKISTHIYNNIFQKNLGVGGGGVAFPWSNASSIHD